MAALVWLTLVVAYAVGAVSATKQLWPYAQISAALQFMVGHPEEKTSLWQKISNDLGGLPLRHVVPSAAKAFPDPAYAALDAADWNDEREPPLIYLSKDAPRGYRFLFAPFYFQHSIHGAILLDPDGKVQNVWRVSQDDLPWEHKPDHQIFPHGFEVMRDGSILVAYEKGLSLTRYDYCGRKQWQVAGGFDHSIDLHDDGSFWVWGKANVKNLGRRDLIRMSAKDGSVIRTIAIQDIADANPDIDILGLRQIDGIEGSAWADDPLHPNDIDPLPAALAGYYPGFDAGDLLVSMRSVNLVFVVDPESLEVKWWRHGLARRQHDPDWNDRGTFTIFDNNMHRGQSKIIEVDPRSGARRTMVDGAEYDFYTRHRGKHQELPDGTMLITSSQQGRVFEVAPDGRVTFDFHNRFSEEHGALAVSEARFVPPDFFEELPTCEN